MKRKGKDKPTDREPQEPELDDDDDEEELLQKHKPVKLNCQISIGELGIISPSLKQCQTTALKLLKDKSVRGYLDIYKKKKMFIPSSIG